MNPRVVRGGLIGALVVSVSLVAGCGQGGQTQATPEQPAVAKGGETKHEGWWCVEHGIPEDECSMCLPARTVQREFKDKGDWCAEHDRAKSQCFKCDPSLKEKFAAKYRTKYGEEPPPITED